MPRRYVKNVKWPDDFAASEKKENLKSQQLICHCILYRMFWGYLCCTGYAVKQGLGFVYLSKMCLVLIEKI